jgi:uncharacterized protein YjbI with pentapeptide repeats
MQSDRQDGDFRKLLERYSPQLLCGMTRDRLEAAIRQPAERLGVKFEEGLVKRLLDDVGANDGSLPLLQFVLEKLWDKQEPHLLTHQGYEKICGGSQNINQALANYAEEVYAEFYHYHNGKDRRFKQVFLRLVTLGENADEDTRRIATRAEIGEDNWRDIVTILANRRLVVTNQSEQTQEETVEIIHEVIIKNWRRLQHWIDKYCNELNQLRTIEAAAQKWDDTTKSKHELWSGKKLATARAFQKNKDRMWPLSLLAENFLHVSSNQQSMQRLKNFLWLIILGPVVGGGVAAPNISREVSINQYVQVIRNTPANQCDSYAIRELIDHKFEFIRMGSILVGKNFSCANLHQANLIGADLQGVNLQGVDLRFSYLQCSTGKAINQTELVCSNLRPNINLKDADLRGTKLQGINLSGANLEGADLRNADFEIVNMNDINTTNLKYANLKKAKLQGSKLHGLDLACTDLTGVNLKDVDLTSVNFDGTDDMCFHSFQGVSDKRITSTQIKAAKNWQKAKYSDKFSKKLGLK